MRKNQIWSIVIISIMLSVIVVGIIISTRGGGDNQFIETKYYDANHNPLSISPLAVIDGIEGIAFVRFEINIENLDKFPLTFSVKSITPTIVDTAKPTEKITIPSKQTGKLSTSDIDIQQFVGKVQEFCVTVVSDPITSARKSAEKTGCISLDVREDPMGTFGVTLDSDLTDSGTNPGCTENWQCSAWGTCNNNIQTRTCTDLNNCGTVDSKPSLQQSCGSSSFETNAVGGVYKKLGVWIKVNGITYDYGGYSTYTCSTMGAQTILSTPEGHPICTRTGYDIATRVYLHDGTYGIIFKT